MVQGSGIDSPQGRAKLSTLLETYESVVYRSLRSRGVGVGEAQDLTQGFVVKLLEGKVVGNADPRKGSFCRFLVNAAWDYTRNAWRDAGRQKRGGGLEHVSTAYPQTEALLEAEGADADADPYLGALREVARILIANVGERLRAEYTGDRAPRFDPVFRMLVHGAEPGEQARIADELAMTKSAVAVELHRMHKRWRRLGLEEAARLCGSVEEAEELWGELVRVFEG